MSSGHVFGLQFVLCAAAVAAGGQTVQEVEPNNDANRPQRVAAPCTIAGAVNARLDRDFFSFEVPESTFLRITVTGVQGVDLILTVRGPTRNVVAQVNGQPQGKPEDLVCRAKEGTHTLEVAAVTRPAARPGGAYTLTLREHSFDQPGPSVEQIKASIRKGLGFLARSQQREGWWEPKATRHGITGLALAALAGENLAEYQPVVNRSVRFFKRSYTPPGTFARSPALEARYAGSVVGRSGHFIYQHAISLLGLSEQLRHHEETELRQIVSDAVDVLVRSQNTATKPATLGGPAGRQSPFFGGWKYSPEDMNADLSASGWCFIALAAAQTAGLEIPAQAPRDYAAFVLNCFDEERAAYGYDPAAGRRRITNTTNSIGVLSTLLCGERESPHVQQGLEAIRDNFPVWETEGGRGSYPFYYWYYASRAMFVAGGNDWKRWRSVICPMLIEHQAEDGSWGAAQDETKVGTNYTTAMAVLILQLCSGNPPAYLKAAKPPEQTAYSCPRCVNDIADLLDAAAGDARTKGELIEDLRKLIQRYRQCVPDREPGDRPSAP